MCRSVVPSTIQHVGRGVTAIFMQIKHGMTITSLNLLCHMRGVMYT